MIHQTNINLSNFNKRDLIGKGNFGEVFQVRENRTGNIYAAKISQVDTDHEPEGTLINLQREVDILSHIKYPSIIKFIGFSSIDFDGNNKPVIITNYYPKASLSNYISSHPIIPLNDTQKLIIIYGIASGMAYLHKNNIIHRDLKPENILLDDNFYPVICDFGISKNQKTEKETTLELKGTPLYLAPEIIEDLKYSKAGDVFAFGIVVFEIMTGQKPFQQFRTMYKILSRICKGQRPDLDEFDIGDSYKQLIQSCWAQDPDERLSFEQIKDMLKSRSEFIKPSVDRNRYQNYINYLDESTQRIKNAFRNKHARYNNNHRLNPTELYKKGEEYEHVNIGEAIKYYKKAAQKGKLKAYIKLGDIYREGKNGRIDLEKSLSFYIKAADINPNYQTAQIKIAQVNSEILKNKGDSGDSVDYMKACEYFKREADLGDTNSQIELDKAEQKLSVEAKDLEFGNGVTKMNKCKARKLYKFIADLGNTQAMNNYSRIAEHGIGGSIDYGEALKYSKKSADLGDKVGMYHYGLMLEEGQGTRVDLDEAMKYYKMSADLGIKEAMFSYAKLLQKKDKSELSIVRKYYKKSAELGYENAMVSYAFMAMNGVGGSVNYKEALKYFKLAADNNNMNGMYRYGLMLEYGDGIKVDKEKAARYVKNAAKMGLRSAQTHFGLMLEKGIGVQTNIKKAIKYYQMASQRGDPKATSLLNNLLHNNNKDDDGTRLRRAPSVDRISQSNFNHRRRRSSSVNRNHHSRRNSFVGNIDF